MSDLSDPYGLSEDRQPATEFMLRFEQPYIIPLPQPQVTLIFVCATCRSIIGRRDVVEGAIENAPPPACERCHKPEPSVERKPVKEPPHARWLKYEASDWD